MISGIITGGVTLARGALTALKPLAVPALLFGLGIAAGVGLEHRGPLPFPLSLLGESLAVQRDTLEAQISAPITGYAARLHAMTGDRDAWRAANGRCEAKRTEEASRAVEQITQASAGAARAASGAFDQGYAAGRAAGQRSCRGTTNAPSPPSNPAGPAAGVLRDNGDDFAAAWTRSAYQPGAAVPGER